MRFTCIHYFQFTSPVPVRVKTFARYRYLEGCLVDWHSNATRDYIQVKVSNCLSLITNSHHTTIQVQTLKINDLKKIDLIVMELCVHLKKTKYCYHTRYEVFEDRFLY